MALQNLKELSSLFDRNNQEKIRKDRLEAQKLKNEQDKLLLERAKIAGQFQKDRVETKATETDTLGKELDNKQTKLGLIGQLADLLIPSAGGVDVPGAEQRQGISKTERQSAVDIAKDKVKNITDIPMYMPPPPTKAKVGDTQPPDTPTIKGPVQQPQQLPPVPTMGQSGINIPTPEWVDTKETEEILGQQADSIRKV